MINKKERKKNTFIFIAGMIFYLLNRFVIKRLDMEGIIGYILSCHFNDFRGGLTILAYINIMLSYSKYSYIHITKLFTSIMIALLCGVFWEYIFPFVFPRGTPDPLDLVAYCFGGFVFSVIHSIWHKKAQRKDIL